MQKFHAWCRYWEGKRGAAIGVFQQVIAGKENREALNEVIAMLRNTQSPQVEYFVKIIGKWIKENPTH
jgi:intraflagellar transport protein 56